MQVNISLRDETSVLHCCNESKAACRTICMNRFLSNFQLIFVASQCKHKPSVVCRLSVSRCQQKLRVYWLGIAIIVMS